MGVQYCCRQAAPTSVARLVLYNCGLPSRADVIPNEGNAAWHGLALKLAESKDTAALARDSEARHLQQGHAVSFRSHVTSHVAGLALT